MNLKTISLVKSLPTDISKDVIYFVNTSNGEDGYIYFNGKRYATGNAILNLIGTIPSGGGNTIVEYIQNQMAGVAGNYTLSLDNNGVLSCIRNGVDEGFSIDEQGYLNLA